MAAGFGGPSSNRTTGQPDKPWLGPQVTSWIFVGGRTAVNETNAKGSSYITWLTATTWSPQAGQLSEGKQ